MQRLISMTLALGAATGCSAPSRPPAPPDGCPGEAFLEAVHAATFHFEHGTREDGDAALRRARAAAPAVPDATASEVVRRLAVVAAAADRKSGAVIGELELIRLSFREWRCLPEPLHEGFHRALPPL